MQKITKIEILRFFLSCFAWSGALTVAGCGGQVNQGDDDILMMDESAIMDEIAIDDIPMTDNSENQMAMSEEIGSMADDAMADGAMATSDDKSTPDFWKNPENPEGFGSRYGSRANFPEIEAKDHRTPKTAEDKKLSEIAERIFGGSSEKPSRSSAKPRREPPPKVREKTIQEKMTECHRYWDYNVRWCEEDDFKRIEGFGFTHTFSTCGGKCQWEKSGAFCDMQTGESIRFPFTTLNSEIERKFCERKIEM